MKSFTDLPARSPQIHATQQSTSKQYFIKKGFLSAFDRSRPVKDAVLQWLLSFPSGITKKEFLNQLCKLDVDDSKATAQLKLSEGKRAIQLFPRVKPPKLAESIIDTLALHQLVAIEGNTGKKAIESFLDTLPAGGVYILDVNELVLNYIDYQHRGNAPQIIEQSNRASILVILGLEKPIALPYHIRDTLFQLAVVRKKDPDKYTLSTWNYTHEWFLPEYKQAFTHFSI